MGLDEIAGQRRLVLLIETRASGGVQLVPVRLALGTDLQTELRKLVAEPLGTFPATQIPQLHARLGLALQCALHLPYDANTAAGWLQRANQRPRSAARRR